MGQVIWGCISSQFWIIQSGSGIILSIGADENKGVIASFQLVLEKRQKLVLPQTESVVFHRSNLEATSHRSCSQTNICSCRFLKIMSWCLRRLKLLQVSSSSLQIVCGIRLTLEMSGWSCLEIVNYQ